MAKSGEAGSKRQCSGKDGEDCFIPVPVGTIVRDKDTARNFRRYVIPYERLLVAKGGGRGLGNVNFKSAVNRAPQKFTKGKPGEARELIFRTKIIG